jgi:DNA-binding NtrC family response regulator
MSERRILIVDDNQDNQVFLSLLLERQGRKFSVVDSGAQALAMLEANPVELVITDLMMPGMNGIELLEKIKERWPGVDVIIVTAFGSIPTAIEAIKKGAFSYLLRPFEPDEVLLTIKKIFELQAIRSENTMLREELSKALRYDKIIGRSTGMQAIYKLVDQVAVTNATVLVLGESGVGKELIARAIHNKSPRANGPFVKVACAALPEPLLESELFGHEKGAFTGAIAARKGRFELADNGSLFLDEIGEISPAVQVKLLRAIQEREFERIGGTRTIKTDTRFITATNKNLADEVAAGRFREDLYYRLNVITVEPPPLRERREDIPLLVYHFLERYRTDTNKDITAVSDEALAKLAGYDWPGNVRELQNVVERAVVLCQAKVIDLVDLPEGVRGRETSTYIPKDDAEIGELKPLKQARAEWEKAYLERALARCKGNISHTAELIGIARKNVQEKIKQFGIDVEGVSAKE